MTPKCRAILIWQKCCQNLPISEDLVRAGKKTFSVILKCINVHFKIILCEMG